MMYYDFVVFFFFAKSLKFIAKTNHVSTSHPVRVTRYHFQSRNSFNISTAFLIASNRVNRGFQRKLNQFEGNAERTLTKSRQSEYQIGPIWMFSPYSVASEISDSLKSLDRGWKRKHVRESVGSEWKKIGNLAGTPLPSWLESMRR